MWSGEKSDFCRKARSPGTNKYEVPEMEARLSPVLSALQAAGSDTLTAIAVLVVAIGVAGIAILVLFAKKKI